jgi:hypothetical protein
MTAVDNETVREILMYSIVLIDIRTGYLCYAALEGMRIINRGPNLKLRAHLGGGDDGQPGTHCTGDGPRVQYVRVVPMSGDGKNHICRA